MSNPNRVFMIRTELDPLCLEVAHNQPLEIEVLFESVAGIIAEAAPAAGKCVKCTPFTEIYL